MASDKSKQPTSPEEWGVAYEERYVTYQGFTKRLETLIRELFNKHSIEIAQMESRTKDIDRFIEKIQRKGEKYQNPLVEVTDLVGIRIIVYYREDLEKVGEIIRKEFDIDWENSIDKAETLDPDRFGYLSIHYVVSLSPPRKQLTEWKDFTPEAYTYIAIFVLVLYSRKDFVNRIDYKNINIAPEFIVAIKKL